MPFIQTKTKTHPSKITHVLQAFLTLPRRIRTPLSPPQLHALIRAIECFVVLTQPIRIAHVVCNAHVARARVIGSATPRVARAVAVAGLVCAVGDLRAVARVADARRGGTHCDATRQQRGQAGGRMNGLAKGLERCC
jgi:hypothetical protein